MALPSPPPVSDPGRSSSVVIVGAGLAGLSAAVALAEGSPHRRVLVLEASERVGGRTASTRSSVDPRVVFDLGGQWIGARQSAALALARAAGAALQAQHCSGRRVLQMGADVRTYSGLIPNASCGVLLDAQVAIWLLKCLQCVLAAWCCCWCCGSRRVRRWADGTSMEDLAARVMWTRGGRALLRIVVQGLFGAEPRGVSVLAFCRYVDGSGGAVEEMSEIGPGSLQAWTLRGGAQQLSVFLARRLQAAGGELLLGHAVSAVERLGGSSADDGAGAGGAGGAAGGVAPDHAAGAAAAATPSPPPSVRVTCANGASFLARHVIIAAPPPIVRATIAFSPPLSERRRFLLEAVAMGSIVKSIAVYARAWWRERGFSGEVICDTESDPQRGPAFNIFDACTPSAAEGEGGGAGAAAGAFGFPTAPSARYLAAPAAAAGASAPLASHGASGAGTAPSAAAAAAPAAAEIVYVEEEEEEEGEGGEEAPVGSNANGSGDAPTPSSRRRRTRRLLPALVCFVNGDRAAERLDPAARRSAILGQLSRWFGGAAEALAPLEYIEQDWVAYPWTRGCPIASYGRGVLGAGQDSGMAAPEWPDGADDAPTSGGGGGARVHRLHFCGTETATVGTGFMDGALRSGARVAGEVASALAAGSDREPRDADEAPRRAAPHAEAAVPAAVLATGTGGGVLTAPLLST